MKKIIIPLLFLINSILYAFPKMIPITIDSLDIEMSETLVTVKDYEEYLKTLDKYSINHFESRMKRIIDEEKYDIKEDLPAWGMTWLEVVDYCNWLSKENNLEPCYEISKGRFFVTVVNINQSANGYRMPYVRELLLVSGIRDGLSREQYEKENTHGIKNDGNHCNVLTVYEGKKNRYGIYDVLGNKHQFCSDFYKDDYDYFDYNLSYYGPEEYTPPAGEDKDLLSSVRCFFGGHFSSTYEDIQKKVIFDVFDEYGWNNSGIRLVKELNPTGPVIGKKMTVKENLRLRKNLSTGSESITTMKSGTKVKILEIGKADNIENIQSSWVKVEILPEREDKNGNEIEAGTIGWCFSGYLN